MTSPALTGGCLCGGVRFEYSGPLGGELGRITLCHCSQCRRAQGYAAAVAPAQAAGFRLQRGQALLREFESSPGKFRAFCSVCGAPIYSRRGAAPDRLRLRLGAFDETPPGLAIEAHIHTAGRPDWALSHDAPRYPGAEPERG